jgi:VIT1/CCC1 family predicted Fe2+/Mn2+ transporter
MPNLNKHIQGVAMGMVDGVITVLGSTAGVSGATASVGIVLIAGLGAGIANGIATTVGFVMAQHTEAEERHRRPHTDSELFTTGALCFIAAMLVSLLLVSPYALFKDTAEARVVSVFLGFTMLFAYGFVHGKRTKSNPLIEGTKLGAVGIAAAGICFFIGEWLGLSVL